MEGWGGAGPGVEGRLCGSAAHKGRIHPRSCTLPEKEREKKEGDPFKCGAAALIYWAKVGEKNEVAEVR